VFFSEYLCKHRRASPQTIASYRETLRLLLQFLKTTSGIEPVAMKVLAEAHWTSTHRTEGLGGPSSLQRLDDPRNTTWLRRIQSSHAKAFNTTVLPSNGTEHATASLPEAGAIT
jgi:hypothetical protein